MKMLYFKYGFQCKMLKYGSSNMIKHPIPPLYDKASKVLILGSFPSVKSRETAFFYGHPQNRFWRILANIFECSNPITIEEKKALALGHGLALWDVIGECEISGSADNTIKNAVPNDLSVIFDNSDITAIFANGKASEKYYNMYIKPVFNRDIVCLPSTSPANAAWNTDRLTEAWKVIKL